MNKAKAILEQSAPFNEFDRSVLDRFTSTAREQRYSASEALYHEMSAGDEIYFIVEGTIRISVELASAHHLSEDIEGGAGDLVGEGRFIMEGPRPATVTATSNVTALVWDVSAWKEIADELPEIGYHLAVFVGKILFTRVQKLRDHLIDDISWGIE